MILQAVEGVRKMNVVDKSEGDDCNYADFH